MLKCTTIFIRSSIELLVLRDYHISTMKDKRARLYVFFILYIYIYIYIIKSHCLALQALNHWFSQPKKKKGIEPLTLEKLICISLKSEA